MKRRQALLGIAGAGIGLLAPLESSAQSGSGKRPVIGLLDGGERLTWWAAFKRQMRELGYVEGETVAYEARYAKGNLDLLPELARELVRLNPAVIVVASGAAAQAARRATDRIPIVTASSGDPLSTGLAASLARPGGNVTGVTSISADLTAKRLDLIREILPKLARLAVVWHSDNVGTYTLIRELQAVTAKANIALRNLGVRKAEELDGAFVTAIRERVQAVHVPTSPLLYAERRRIAELAVKHKLPTTCSSSDLVDAGCLVSYGTHYPDLFRRAAVYVDKILKGANPAEMPIEQPTKFELVVNVRTAKLIGVAIPQSVLVRADRIID